MKNKNIVVTGGLGFIGSHIVEELLDDNKVIVIDNMSSGKLENLKDPEHENLKIIKEDLNNCDLEEILNGIDYVFHLAALASVPGSVAEPLSYNENNIDASVKLFIAAKNNDVKKIIFSSSSAVYGENPNMPLKESENFMPCSPYAAQKASCELYLKSFNESYGLNYVALRYFNVFGPKQDENSPYAAVIPKFISAILNGESPVIYGDGEQSRDFIYVKEIAKANIKAAESDYNGVINVALGKSMTINHLFEVIRDVLESDIEVKYLDERPGDIKHSLADISKLEKINFKPDDDKFEEQLRETVRWFRKEME
ncbi:SDR family oxidoreductase [uncultured Methanobrevibacter sp.]|uniref:SDR family oxidoreductase n=1 Tax=uncultured Methanobrevibacter sp. TaxID=253161 RepID=UPI0026203808